MQRGAVFGRVDDFAGEHRVAARLHPGGLGEPDQLFDHFGGDALLRIVVEDVVEQNVKAVRTASGSAAKAALTGSANTLRDSVVKPLMSFATSDSMTTLSMTVAAH